MPSVPTHAQPRYYLRSTPQRYLIRLCSPALTLHQHPKLLGLIPGVHSGVWTIAYDMYPSLWHHTEYFRCPENPLCSADSSLPLLNPWQPQSFFTVSIVLPFPEGHRVGIVQYAASPIGFFHLVM